MKKLIFSIVFATLPITGIMAQEAYNEIRAKASAVLSDPLANGMVKDINRFKVDALDYLLIKMREQMPDSSTVFLDNQALAMNNFISLYIKKILKFKDMPKARQIDIIRLFMDASYSNPLFNDTDQELTLGYYVKSESLTRFSLDTDWQKAVTAIVASMKEE